MQDVVARGLDVPTSLAFLSRGRILVAEQRGLVRVIAGGRTRRPFLDLRPRVNTFNERGLMAIAVRGGFLYAYYAVEAKGRPQRDPTGMRLSRFRIRGERALPASETIVLGHRSTDGCKGALARADCIPANCGCHIGGDIQFGAGGSIFLSTGDAANAGFTNSSALRAQQLDSLAGKLLRVRPDGSGLRSNPFWSGRASDNRSKVWALGLRNPFRFRLQPGTGVLPLVADVGWLDWEELDVAVRGSNLGWPCFEGRRIQPRYSHWAACTRLYRRHPHRLRAPVYAYARGRGAGIVGGAFVASFPGQYRDAYFFADVVRGWIRYVPRDGLAGGPVRPRPFARGAEGPVDLEVGPDGDLYYLAVKAGELRRIQYRG
jgi:glucose/arabinose dehydrogenase